MEPTEERAVSAGAVNYDDQPIVQMEIDGTDYRLDTGLGAAVAVSSRETGTWQWVPITEGRWDGRKLRARGVEHAVAVQLAEALGRAMADRDDC